MAAAGHVQMRPLMIRLILRNQVPPFIADRYIINWYNVTVLLNFAVKLRVR
jgi:hypothetical protein